MHIITNMLKQGAKRKVTTYNIPQLLGDEQIPPRPPWLGLEDPEDPEDPEPQTTDLKQQPKWLIEVSNDFLYAIRLQIPPSAASSLSPSPARSLPPSPYFSPGSLAASSLPPSPSSQSSSMSSLSFYSAQSTIDDNETIPSPPSPPSSPPSSPLQDDIREIENKSYNSGATYNGMYNFTYSQKTGWGTMVWQNGDRYHGNWSVNKMHGLGVLVEYNEDATYNGTYVGEYINGYRTKGTYFWADGSVYKGEWDHDDNPSGVGKMWISGDDSSYDVYVGEFKNGSMNGRGTYYWGNGNTFQGEWVNDKRNGYGIMTYKTSGYIYNGLWGIGNGGVDDNIITCNVSKIDNGEEKPIGYLTGWQYDYYPTNDTYVRPVHIMTTINEETEKEEKEERGYIDGDGMFVLISDETSLSSSTSRTTACKTRPTAKSFCPTPSWVNYWPLSQRLTC